MCVPRTNAIEQGFLLSHSQTHSISDTGWETAWVKDVEANITLVLLAPNNLGVVPLPVADGKKLVGQSLEDGPTDPQLLRMTRKSIAQVAPLKKRVD